MNCDPTVLGDGMVIVPALYGLYAFSPMGEKVWQQGFWGYPGNISVGADGSLYFVVTAFGFGVTELWSVSRTGQINWHEPIWDGVRDTSVAPVVGVDGTLYLGLEATADGAYRLAAIDPTTGLPKIVRTFSPGGVLPGVLELRGGKLASGVSLLTRNLDLVQELQPFRESPHAYYSLSAVDYEDNLFGVDFIQQGPLMAIAKYRFGSRKAASAVVAWRAGYGSGAVLANDGSVFAYGSALSCLDSAGKAKWGVSLGIAWPNGPQPPVVASDGTLYVAFSGSQSQGAEQIAYLSAIEIPPAQPAGRGASRDATCAAAADWLIRAWTR